MFMTNWPASKDKAAKEKFIQWLASDASSFEVFLISNRIESTDPACLPQIDSFSIFIQASSKTFGYTVI